MTDEELMRHVALGDEAAYAELYDRHAPVVLGVLYKMVGQRQEAEELLQEAYWRVWDKAETFDPSRASFRTWLFSIARRIGIDWLRRRSARPKSALGDSEAQEQRLAALPSDASVPGDVQLMERHEAVRDAVAQLSAEQRQVIELAYFGGKTRREIAAETNIPLGTVHTRVRLGLKHMQRELVEKGWGNN